MEDQKIIGILQESHERLQRVVFRVKSASDQRKGARLQNVRDMDSDRILLTPQLLRFPEVSEVCLQSGENVREDVARYVVHGEVESKSVRRDVRFNLGENEFEKGRGGCERRRVSL